MNPSSEAVPQRKRRLRTLSKSARGANSLVTVVESPTIARGERMRKCRTSSPVAKEIESKNHHIEPNIITALLSPDEDELRRKKQREAMARFRRKKKNTIERMRKQVAEWENRIWHLTAATANTSSEGSTDYSVTAPSSPVLHEKRMQYIQLVHETKRLTECKRAAINLLERFEIFTSYITSQVQGDAAFVADSMEVDQIDQLSFETLREAFRSRALRVIGNQVFEW